MNLFIIRGKCR